MHNYSRRFILCSGVAATFVGSHTHAGPGGSLCAMTRMSASGSGQLKAGSAAAKKDVRDVLDALGYENLDIPVYSSRQIENAAAFPNLNGQGRAIVYNPDFLSRLYEINDWAPASVIAHEIGHHLSRDRASQSSHRRELGADEISGCAMAWMGATENQATVAMTKGLPVNSGSSTHPGTQQRVSIITTAYKNCQSLR